GAQPRRGEVAQGLEDPRPRRRLQGGHRRRPRVAGREADRAVAQRRLRRRVPRPARSRVRRPALLAARPGGLRLRGDRDRALVEEPPATRGSEMEELGSLAESSSLTLMPGHLLLYHPGVSKLKEPVDTGELGDVLCVYGNRQNLGKIRKDENALWSLGVHDLSVVLYLLGEEPSEVIAHGRDFLTEGVEDVVFCYLRFPSGGIAHMHLSW